MRLCWLLYCRKVLVCLCSLRVNPVKPDRLQYARIRAVLLSILVGFTGLLTSSGELLKPPSTVASFRDELEVRRYRGNIEQPGSRGFNGNCCISCIMLWPARQQALETRICVLTDCVLSTFVRTKRASFAA